MRDSLEASRPCGSMDSRDPRWTRPGPPLTSQPLTKATRHDRQGRATRRVCFCHMHACGRSSCSQSRAHLPACCLCSSAEMLMGCLGAAARGAPRLGEPPLPARPGAWGAGAWDSPLPGTGSGGTLGVNPTDTESSATGPPGPPPDPPPPPHRPRPLGAFQFFGFKKQSMKRSTRHNPAQNTRRGV